MAAVEETSKFSEEHPMKGGDGPNSYANNSTLQKGTVDAAKELLRKAVAEELDVNVFGFLEYQKRWWTKNSPAWNKGRIHYSNSTDEVVRAYEAQHAEDMECFLNARAQEIADGGMMVLVIPGRSNTLPHSDMARKGLVSEEKVDTFNIPVYAMTPQELEADVERNKHFSLKKLETIPHTPVPPTVSPIQLVVSHMRAGFEGIVKQQFGEEILDDLFDLYLKKLEEQPSIIASGTETAIIFLAVLKRM
ncbi:hypothetical protein DVH24_023528 [Malus domestica]|uniref:Uncharacterized protein n=1 Tax=Malus domestica TaxID=3750 RepID=A0A498I4Y9_MALDO|nr:hypothetical protein DVH24_023528 [Malus domestica]